MDLAAPFAAGISLGALNVFLQIVFIDLVLAGDNAIIVGMVAARVPQEMRRQVILFGVGAAVVMRIGFSLIAVQLLAVTGLKLLGGLLLLWVCWRLGAELRSDYGAQVSVGADRGAEAAAEGGLSTLRPAVIQIVIADLSMSIDNVLAIAAVSRDHPLLLVFGLALSVAFMIFAATLIARLLKRLPWIAWLGLALILWVALAMMWEGAEELRVALG